MNQILNEKQFLFSCLVLTFNLQCLLEFVFCTLVFTCRSENQAPDYPVISIFRLLLYTFSNFLDGFNYISFFELRECPMHMSVVTISIKFFGLAADVECLLIYHVHVEKECKIVVCVGMSIVYQDAPLEMFYCLRIVSNLEVGKSQVIV